MRGQHGKVLRLAPIQSKEVLYMDGKDQYYVGGSVVNYFYGTGRYLVENIKSHFNPNRASEHKSYEDSLTIGDLIKLKDRLNSKRLK